MEELIAMQGELIARLQDDLGGLQEAIKQYAIDLLEQEKAHAEEKGEWEDAHRTSREQVTELTERVKSLERDLAEIDITPQYRALYDRAEAFLEKTTGARKPSQAECMGIEEAYELSKWLTEYDI